MYTSITALTHITAYKLFSLRSLVEKNHGTCDILELRRTIKKRMVRFVRLLCFYWLQLKCHMRSYFNWRLFIRLAVCSNKPRTPNTIVFLHWATKVRWYCHSRQHTGLFDFHIEAAARTALPLANFITQMCFLFSNRWVNNLINTR